MQAVELTQGHSFFFSAMYFVPLFDAVLSGMTGETVNGEKL